jgi:hypothetical protein
MRGTISSPWPITQLIAICATLAEIPGAGRILVPVAADETARQDSVGGNAEAAARGQDGILDTARDQRILDLQITDGVRGRSSPQAVGTHLGKSNLDLRCLPV